MAVLIPVTLNHVNKAALDDFIQGKSYKVMLFTTAVLSTHDNISDLTEITAGHGYSAGGPAVAVTSHQDGSAAYVTAAQPTLAATGGNIGPYIGVGVYEVSGGKLVGGYNEPEAVTILSGASQVIQLNQLTGFFHWGSVEPS